MTDLARMVLKIIERERLVPCVKHIFEHEPQSLAEEIFSLSTRYSQLICLIPEAIMLDMTSLNQLLLYLRDNYDLPISLCQFLNISEQGEQYCTFYRKNERIRCPIILGPRRCPRISHKN